MATDAAQKVAKLYEAMEWESLRTMNEYLRSDGADPVLHNKAKTAVTALGVVARRRQTEGARDALHFMMARALTEDPDKLAEYIRITQPHSPIVPLLPARSES